ncbi:SDR family oxidoreductase [Rhodophyticola sp. CCM32]|uniref:SDR family NAD(P)-dependent oxidoreductase n=1 Tax=Rhodophyticola sp. CCM32 TaxID=2916397 RepID=UPI00107F9002|nr:SDR family NAD(P)-dependent oxidoreductase [Rhodophyticola sp. CCM32]QBY00497.1 SDR family oxidoreductase [Rhodophyticola sp. CCM32]
MRDPVAIVTGGAGTLGRAIGDALAADGMRVILADMVPVADAGAGQAGVACDITDAEDRARLIAGAGSDLRVLVNCAGTGQVVPLPEISAALWDKVIALNLSAAFHLCQLAAGGLGEGGAIINISSVSGLRAGYGRVAYGVSKAGLIQLTRQIAVELGPRGITCNTVAPGPVEGPLTRGIHPQSQVEDYLNTIPQGRYAIPEEIASAVAFLAGPGARHITGQCLAVDGGFLAAGVGVRDAQQAPPTQ